MAKGICRCRKIKGASGGFGAYIHNERERSHSNSNPDIDFEKSKDNYSIGMYDNDMTYNQRADARIQEGYTGKKAVRKDAVKMVEFLFTASGSNALPEDLFKNYLEDSYRWLGNHFGFENIIADDVHTDETTLHLHAVIVPLTDDGRLSCKEVIGGKKQLQAMQDSFFNEVSSKYGLERGDRADLDDPDRVIKKHVPQQQYKEQTIVELDKKIKDAEQNLNEITKSLEGVQDRLQYVINRENKLRAEQSALEAEKTEFKRIKASLSSLLEKLHPVLDNAKFFIRKAFLEKQSYSVLDSDKLPFEHVPSGQITRMLHFRTPQHEDVYPVFDDGYFVRSDEAVCKDADGKWQSVPADYAPSPEDWLPSPLEDAIALIDQSLTHGDQVKNKGIDAVR